MGFDEKLPCKAQKKQLNLQIKRRNMVIARLSSKYLGELLTV